jgi:aminoglycoside 6-adenylyltransferase
MVYFQDGTKMDICLGYLEDLREIAKGDSLPKGYDVGYEVLLDKDGVTQGVKPPTFTAFILKPPSEPQYQSRVESFWMDSTYVAKYLWRDDIVAVKFRLGSPDNKFGGLAGYVREMLEWSVGADSGWTWKPKSCGRHLDKALDPETRREMIATYAGGDMDDLWESLFRTAALYRKAALKVGEHLGYTYPHDLDRRVLAFHQTLRNLDKSATREELADLLSVSYESRC